MQVTVPALDVQQANLKAIDIGQVAIGPITVGDLVLNNADFTMSAAQVVLQSVSVTMHIHVTVDWDIHIGMPDWIPDINIGDSFDLGTLTFGPINIGNVVVPGLSNIQLHIPTLTAQNMSVSADPLGLTANNATADQIHATNVALPSAGFSIAGLALSSIQGNTISVPAAKLDSGQDRPPPRRRDSGPGVQGAHPEPAGRADPADQQHGAARHSGQSVYHYDRL